MNNSMSMFDKMGLILPVGIIVFCAFLLLKKRKKNSLDTRKVPSEMNMNSVLEKGWNLDDKTVNPYEWNTSQQSDETVNPYSWNGTQESDETVNPYSWNGTQESDETVNPYSRNRAQESDETVNPYSWNRAQQSDETVNPYAFVANVIYEEEDETVDPYGINWMPNIVVGLLMKENEKEWSEKLNFFGSVWMGSTAECELKIQNLDSSGYCAELTYGGGNLYVRNLSRGGEVIYLDGQLLEDDLVPLNKDSVLSMGQVRITMEYLSNNLHNE